MRVWLAYTISIATILAVAAGTAWYASGQKPADSGPAEPEPPASLYNPAVAWQLAAEVEQSENERLRWQVSECSKLLQAASDGRTLWVERARAAERQLADLSEERASLMPAGAKR